VALGQNRVDWRRPCLSTTMPEYDYVIVGLVRGIPGTASTGSAWRSWNATRTGPRSAQFRSCRTTRRQSEASSSPRGRGGTDRLARGQSTHPARLLRPRVGRARRIRNTVGAQQVRGMGTTQRRERPADSSCTTSASRFTSKETAIPRRCLDATFWPHPPTCCTAGADLVRSGVQ